MPIVVFESRRRAPIEIAVPEGGRLMDACDDARAPVPFSCRTASCGTCRVDVLEGMEALEPPDDAEKSVLAIFADPPTRRLACCAQMKPGLTRLRVLPVDEDEDDFGADL
jgi:ferredoxin